MNIVFAATPDFALPTLASLINSEHTVCAVYTQPDRRAGRGRHLKASPVKVFAQKYQIPVAQPVSLKPDADQLGLAALKPDIMVVVAYGLIIPEAMLNIPRFGCINIHASLLPRWRGAAPIHRAIAAGDAVTGVTIMQMDSGLDTGAMLHRRETSIKCLETCGELHERLAKLGATALSEVLPDIESGNTNPEPQNESLVTYANKIEKREAALDWAEPAMQIARKIRAFSPWPVARTKYQGDWMRIWRAEALAKSSSLPVGTVISDDCVFFEVTTGEGVLKVLEVQLPGGKRISTEAFLNANSINGVLLG